MLHGLLFLTRSAYMLYRTRMIRRISCSCTCLPHHDHLGALATHTSVWIYILTLRSWIMLLNGHGRCIIDSAIDLRRRCESQVILHALGAYLMSYNSIDAHLSL